MIARPRHQHAHKLIHTPLPAHQTHSACLCLVSLLLPHSRRHHSFSRCLSLFSSPFFSLSLSHFSHEFYPGHKNCIKRVDLCLGVFELIFFLSICSLWRCPLHLCLFVSNPGHMCPQLALNVQEALFLNKTKSCTTLSLVH